MAGEDSKVFLDELNGTLSVNMNSSSAAPGDSTSLLILIEYPDGVQTKYKSVLYTFINNFYLFFTVGNSDAINLRKNQPFSGFKNGKIYEVI